MDIRPCNVLDEVWDLGVGCGEVFDILSYARSLVKVLGNLAVI